MRLKVIPNNVRDQEWCVTISLSIGDIVALRNIVDVYGIYRAAFKALWGTEEDGFHRESNWDNYGLGDIKKLNSGFLTNVWKIQNFIIHGLYGHIVLCHLKDIHGRDLLVDHRALKLLRRSRKQYNEVFTIKQVPKL